MGYQLLVKYNNNTIVNIEEIIGGGSLTKTLPCNNKIMNGNISIEIINTIPTKFRYMRFSLIKTKTAGIGCAQLSEIKLLDSAGNRLNGSLKSYKSVGGASGETANYAVDNSVDTKGCYSGSWSESNPGGSEWDFGENAIDTSIYTRGQGYTANDTAGRDPSTYQLQFSTDGSNGYVADNVENQSVTDTRKTLAYTGNIDLLRWQTIKPY